jgi:hypothetical protein
MAEAGTRGTKKWLRRIRGAIGMGVTWAIAGGAVGMLVTLGFVVRTGSRPDAPFPIMFGAFGFLTGVVFSGVLALVEGRRRFDQMSIRRFAAWGAGVGLALSATFFLAVSRGDPGSSGTSSWQAPLWPLPPRAARLLRWRWPDGRGSESCSMRRRVRPRWRVPKKTREKRYGTAAEQQTAPPGRIRGSMPIRPEHDRGCMRMQLSSDIAEAWSRERQIRVKRFVRKRPLARAS